MSVHIFRKAEKKKFAGKNVLQLLSLFNQDCQKEQLQMTIEELLESKVQLHCLIADEIDWHNHKPLHCTPEEETRLRAEAVGRGQQFLENNLKYILKALINSASIDIDLDVLLETNPGNLSNIEFINQFCKQYDLPFKLLFWRDWIAKTEHYRENQETIKRFFQPPSHGGIESLHQAIQETAQQFAVAKKQKDHHPDDFALLLSRSEGYLIEETAAIYWSACELGVEIIAYPGRIKAAFKETNTLLTKAQSEGKLEAIHCVTHPSFTNPPAWRNINFPPVSPLLEEFVREIDRVSPEHIVHTQPSSLDGTTDSELETIASDPKTQSNMKTEGIATSKQKTQRFTVVFYEGDDSAEPEKVLSHIRAHYPHFRFWKATSPSPRLMPEENQQQPPRPPASTS